MYVVDTELEEAPEVHLDSPEDYSFPVQLQGGYYDGARLLGVEDEMAVYYNRKSRSLVKYRYDPDDGLLHGTQGAEELLPAKVPIGTYLRERCDDFVTLSSWGRVVIGDGSHA